MLEDYHPIKPKLSGAAAGTTLQALLARRLAAGLAGYDADGTYCAGWGAGSAACYLNWPGKAAAWQEAVRMEEAHLEPDPDCSQLSSASMVSSASLVSSTSMVSSASEVSSTSKEGSTSQAAHLYVQGDNLTVLKLLLPRYQGQVKVIYADPPYNTGKDFVYADNFVLSASAYERWLGRAAAGDAGRYHAQWCALLYPRLLLARELMADDAVLFLSIDDHEYHNLKLLLDEVMGADNFISTMVWQRAYAAKNDAKTVPLSHDYILMYAKNRTCWEQRRACCTLPPEVGPQRLLLRRTLVGDSQEGTKELKRLLDSGVFDGPKPVRLIKYLLTLSTHNSGLILDFFAGSGTTGQAVLELNAADGGARQFILVQRPDPCAPKTPAFHAGFHDIAQIGLKRLAAVRVQLAEAAPQTAPRSQAVHLPQAVLQQHPVQTALSSSALMLSGEYGKPVEKINSNKHALWMGKLQNLCVTNTVSERAWGLRVLRVVPRETADIEGTSLPPVRTSERYELIAPKGAWPSGAWSLGALKLPARVHLVYWALGRDTAPAQVQGQLRALKASLATRGVC